MPSPWLHLAPLLVMLSIAAGIDLRRRRIPNWLTLAILLTGLCQSFLPGHSVTFGSALLGMLAGLLPSMALFLLGALGGGDVKLLVGIGAWLGPIPVLGVFLIEAIVGMIIVLTQALCLGRLQVLLRNSALVAVNVGHVRQLGIDHVKATGQSCRAVEKPLPYAVPVLISTVIVIVTMLRIG